MARVKITSAEHIEIAIRKFRKEVDREGILTEAKERQYYRKPALKRKIAATKLAKRIKRNKSKQRYLMRINS